MTIHFVLLYIYDSFLSIRLNYYFITDTMIVLWNVSVPRCGVKYLVISGMGKNVGFVVNWGF